jgi:hypothetical protein
MFIQNVPLMTSLLSEDVVDQLTDPRSNDRFLSAAAELVVNCTIDAIQAFSQRRFMLLDANPGDAGCQNRALILRELTIENPAQELHDVFDRMQILSKQIKEFKSHGDEAAIRSLVSRELSPLQVSGKLEFIIHSFFSQTTKIVRGRTPEGISIKMSDISKFSSLSKKIDSVDKNLRLKILQQNQKVLSKISVAAMHVIATRINSLPAQESAVLIQMLAPESRHIVLSSEYKSERTFGFLFAEVKTLLARLNESHGVVCFMNIVPKGKERFCLFLQSKGNEFIPISIEDLPKDFPIVVFEAVVQGNRQELALEAFRQYGFSTIILAQAVHEYPFEPGSTTDLPVMRTEMEKVPDVGMDLFKIDHVFLATLDEVLSLKAR